LARAALLLEEVVAGYGDGVVLHRAGLHIAPGERVGLVGRNGAGKTTLMRVVMGLLPVREGSIRYGTQRLDLLDTFEVARLGIAYVPQGRDIFGAFTVEQNLKLGFLGMRSPGARRPAASTLDPAYDAFPWLKRRARELAGSLSGGEQQQLAVARALVSQPGLLMLDEPLEGIQPSVVEQIVEAIGGMCARHGTGLLLIEQNIDAVLALCERVVLIEGGRTGDPADAAALLQDRSPIDRALGL
jgi:ABC-type branched-subunit amino acid transport system ATPase component